MSNSSVTLSRDEHISVNKTRTTMIEGGTMSDAIPLVKSSSASRDGIANNCSTNSCPRTVVASHNNMGRRDCDKTVDELLREYCYLPEAVIHVKNEDGSVVGMYIKAYTNCGHKVYIEVDKKVDVLNREGDIYLTRTATASVVPYSSRHNAYTTASNNGCGVVLECDSEMCILSSRMSRDEVLGPKEVILTSADKIREVHYPNSNSLTTRVFCSDSYMSHPLIRLSQLIADPRGSSELISRAVVDIRFHLILEYTNIYKEVQKNVDRLKEIMCALDVNMAELHRCISSSMRILEEKKNASGVCDPADNISKNIIARNNILDEVCKRNTDLASCNNVIKTMIAYGEDVCRDLRSKTLDAGRDLSATISLV